MLAARRQRCEDQKSGFLHRPLTHEYFIYRWNDVRNHWLLGVCWELGKTPAAGRLALNRWTHMLGYRGHFLTKSRRYSVTFSTLRQARISHRRAQRHPNGEKDPWGRDLDDRIVLVISAWRYAGTLPGSLICLNGNQLRS